MTSLPLEDAVLLVIARREPPMMHGPLRTGKASQCEPTTKCTSPPPPPAFESLITRIDDLYREDRRSGRPAVY
jgi:hypothetical protein